MNGIFGPLPGQWRAVLAGCVFLLTSGMVYGQEPLGSLPEAMIAWAEADGSDYEIWYSQTSGTRWTAPQRISNAPDNADILACPVQLPDGRVAVVWTRFLDVERTRLYFSVRDGEKWTEAAEVETGMEVNMAPTLIRDRTDTVWLAWAGYDGSDDDIYVSRWLPDESRFEVKLRVGKNDFQPDVLPVLYLEGDGFPSVRWQSLEASGYQTVVSHFDGELWSDQRVVDAKALLPDTDIVARRLEKTPRLPPEVIEPFKACIHLPDELPVHTVRFPPPKFNEIPGQ